jgi:hypothetical protein
MADGFRYFHRKDSKKHALELPETSNLLSLKKSILFGLARVSAHSSNSVGYPRGRSSRDQAERGKTGTLPLPNCLRTGNFSMKAGNFAHQAASKSSSLNPSNSVKLNLSRVRWQCLSFIWHCKNLYLMRCLVIHQALSKVDRQTRRSIGILLSCAYLFLTFGFQLFMLSVDTLSVAFFAVSTEELFSDRLPLFLRCPISESWTGDRTWTFRAKWSWNARENGTNGWVANSTRTIPCVHVRMITDHLAEKTGFC